MSVRESSSALPDAGGPERYTRWPALLSLSLGLVLGPIVALVHQQTVYSTNMWACGHQIHAAMHVIPVLSLLVVLLAALDAHRNWRHAGRGVEDEHGSVVATRTRFLALLGIAISIFSSLVILAQWLAIFVFQPCQRA